MSIAKKSIKWLVATIVIFALILTVSLAVGSVTRASATTPQDTEHDVDVHVFVEDSADLGAYPDLIKSTSARVVTVYYCYDIPTEATSTLSMFFAAPVLKYGNTTERPTQIDLNNNFSSIVDISMHTSDPEGYLASSGAATAFNIALKAGATAADLNSYVSGAFDQTKYLFSAQYAIAANAVGAYELDFGTPTMFSLSSSDDVYYPAIENGDFNIRAIIPIPTAVEGLVYTGAEQTGVTVDYTLGYELDEGSIAETNKGNYSATFALLDDVTTCWEGNTITDKTVPWSIAKMQIAIPEVGSGTYTYTGAAQTYAFAADINSTYIEITDGTKTDAGTYTVTASLKDTANTRWAGEGDDIADKVYEDAFVINPFTVAIPQAKSGKTYTYDGTTQTFLYEDELLTDYYTYEPVNGKNAGNYVVVFELKDKDNTVWTGNTTANQSVQFTIAPKAVTLAFTSDNYNAIYNDAITAPVVTAEGVVAGDNLNLGVSGTPEQGDPVGVNDLTATWDTTNTNYTVTGAAATYTITTRYIPIPVKDTTVTYTYTGEPLTFAFTEDVDAAYVVLADNVKTLPGTYTVTANLNTTVHGNNIAWADNGEGEYEYEFVIDPAMVSVDFVGVFNNVEKTLAEDVELAVLANLPTYNVRWFKQGGYTFNNAAATTVTFEMDEKTVYIAYSYAVGAGDADGDGIITAGDVIQMKRYFVGLDAAKLIADADAAWANSSNSDYDAVAVLNTALDVNGTTTFRTNDIVAVREALATGYDYKVVIEEGIQLVKKVNRITVTTYETLDGAGWSLLKALKAGYPVTLGANIAAANEVFNLDSDIPVDINLGGYRLTVKGFTLNTNTTGATLKITNGTLYTVNGITVTAPNGNVVVASVNGYSYDGTSVNLAAYSESLHIENNVAFYIYHEKVNNEPVALADFVETVTSANALNVIAGQRIQDTADRMAEIKQIKESTTLTEEQKATAINAKEVKKAIVEVPVDTHVVVEENANLSVDKLVVKAQSDENAPAVTTFAIEVKNAAVAAEVVAVDISEVKDVINNEKVFVVDEVAIAGVSSKVEVITGENTAADVTKYFAQIGSANYETLQAAINAAANGDVIKLLDNVPNGTGLMTADDSNGTKVGKTFTIDFNGKTYTVTGPAVGSSGTLTQAMHWGAKDNITLKNGSFVVSADACDETIHGANNIVKMALQNYCALTISNMTIDVSAIPYDTYSQDKYQTIAGGLFYNLERPVFGINEGTTAFVVKNSTLTFNNQSTKGIIIEVPEVATIENSTINGAISLSTAADSYDYATVAVVNSTITKGVVNYFADDMVVEDNGIYTGFTAAAKIGSTKYATLQAAIDNVQNNQTITLVKDITDGSGLKTPDIDNLASGKTFTIDFNNKTYTVAYGSVGSSSTETQAMHWGRKGDHITLQNGSIVVSEAAATVPNANGKVVKMAMQNYCDLTVKNMTLDFSNIAVHNYEVKPSYGDYSGHECSVFNWVEAPATACLIEDTTITFNANSNLGVNIEIGGAVIKNSTINGTVSLSSDCAASDVTLINSTVTGGVVAYFAKDGIINSGNYYTVAADATVVSTKAELTAALNANAPMIVINADIDLGGQYNFTAQDTTIDLNGHTLTTSGAGIVNFTNNELTIMDSVGTGAITGASVALYNYAAGTITIEGGTISATYYPVYNRIAGVINANGGTLSGNRAIMNYGLVNIDGAEIVGTVMGVENDAPGVVNLISGSITAPYGIGTFNTVGDGAEVNVSGGTITATSFCISTNGNDTYSTEINVSGGTLVAGCCGIYNAGIGIVTVSDDADITGGESGIEIRAGVLTVTGGTIASTASPTSYAANGNGTTTVGAGIAVAQHTTQQGIEVTITGGTISGHIALLEINPENNSAADLALITITVGTDAVFNGTEEDILINDAAVINYINYNEVIEISTFAELATAIAQVNNGSLVNPTLLIVAEEIPFGYELQIKKSVTIIGEEGVTRFVGYNVTSEYDDAFWINITDANQTVSIKNIVFDHFGYYADTTDPENKIVTDIEVFANVVTYGSACPASTEFYMTNCTVWGINREMMTFSSSAGGCAGYVCIANCEFDATDRLYSTINLLSFYGKQTNDISLNVDIIGCIFKNADKGNEDWPSAAIACYGSTNFFIDTCDFINCEEVINVDNTYIMTCPGYYYCNNNSVVEMGENNVYTHCGTGFIYYAIVDAADLPEGAVLSEDEPVQVTNGYKTITANKYKVLVEGAEGEVDDYTVYHIYYVAVND